MLDYELEFELDDEFEVEYENEEFLPSLLAAGAPLAIRAVNKLLKESEYEDEYEDDYELEAEFEYMLSAEDEAMMYHLANLAANTESEAEAEAFFGAIASLASKALPLARKYAPTLIQGAAKLGRSIWKSPRTRRLVKAVPSVIEGTVKDVASQYSKGKPINRQLVTRALAGNTAKVLQSPKRTKSSMREADIATQSIGRPRRMSRYRRRRLPAYR